MCCIVQKWHQAEQKNDKKQKATRLEQKGKQSTIFV